MSWPRGLGSNPAGGRDVFEPRAQSRGVCTSSSAVENSRQQTPSAKFSNLSTREIITFR